MQLTQFATSVATRFKNQVTMDRRSKSADLIAKKYRFTNPEIVLFFTHPELSTFSMQQRCAYLDITEEELYLLLNQEGFRKFLQEYKNNYRNIIEVQSLESLSNVLSSPRYKTFEGEQTSEQDLSLEQQVFAATAPPTTGAATQVNVQVNNLWSQARQLQPQSYSQSHE